MSRSSRLMVLLACVAAIGAILAPAAAGSSGDITKALSNAEGTEAEIAGSVSWTGCEHSVLRWEGKPPIVWPIPEWPEAPFPPEKEIWPPWPPPYCGWVPFVTVGPGDEKSDCSAPERENPDSLGEGVTLVWSAAERRDQGNEDFDVKDVPLDQGGRLVCLSVTEIAPVPVFCYLVIGPGVAPCKPFAMARFYGVLGSALIDPPAQDVSVAPKEERPPVDKSPDADQAAPAGSPPAGRPRKKCVRPGKGARSSGARPRCKRRHAPKHGPRA